MYISHVILLKNQCEPCPPIFVLVDYSRQEPALILNVRGSTCHSIRGLALDSLAEKSGSDLKLLLIYVH